MTMKNIAILLVIGMVVGAGALYVVSRDSSDTNETQSSQSESPDAPTIEEKKPITSEASTKELLAQGKDQQCSFSFTDDSAAVSGTAYFASTQSMRMDFTAVAAEKTTTGSMIIMQDSQTFWDNETKQGFKMSLSDEQINQNENISSNDSFDTDQKVKFACESWSVDTSLFTVPADVTVTDFNSLIPAN